MSFRSRLQSKKLADGQSLEASFNSEVFDIKTVDNIGINISASSVTDNTGTFEIEWRVYKDANEFSDWAELTLSSTPTLADAAATFAVILNQLPPGQIRVKFTAAGGTPDGTCDIWISANQL